MLPIHQTALFSNSFSLLPCSAFLVPCSLFFRLTPGLEPCSPHSQCGTLPDKLKPTFCFQNHSSKKEWGFCHQNWIRTNIPGLRTWYAAVAPSDNFVVSRLYEIICCSPTNLEKCSEAEAPLLCISSTKFYLTFETSLPFYFSTTG